MTYLRLTSNDPVWPYLRQQLLADNPNVSFRLDPSPEELEPFGVYIVQPTDPPEHDPALQQPVEVHPVERDDQWFQAWELQDVPPLSLVPDWRRFKAVMLASADVNAVLAAAMPLCPLAVLALPSALERAVSGDCTDFRGCWAAIRQAVAVPEVVVDAVVAQAQAANLPAGFIEMLA